MFSYTVEMNEKVNIKTPFKMISNEHEQQADVIRTTLKYENGLEIYFVTYSNRIEVLSNYELVRDQDGSFIVKENT